MSSWRSLRNWSGSVLLEDSSPSLLQMDICTKRLTISWTSTTVQWTQLIWLMGICHCKSWTTHLLTKPFRWVSFSRWTQTNRRWLTNFKISRSLMQKQSLTITSVWELDRPLSWVVSSLEFSSTGTTIVSKLSPRIRESWRLFTWVKRL